MSTISSGSTESSAVTVQPVYREMYRRQPVRAGGSVKGYGSGSNTESPQYNARAPGIRYPTVSHNSLPPALRGSPSTVSSTPPATPPYAVPYPRGTTYSQSTLQADSLRHRVSLLESENMRLQRTQEEVVADANRRVEMHVNEIRMLKEETRKLQTANREMKELCCFLDDERQKTRSLSREWQKFGKYTSETMKHEISSYQQRVRGLEQRQVELMKENDELKQLCLYLDEQRQCLLEGQREGEESEDLGLPGSSRSSDSGAPSLEGKGRGWNQQKEAAIRMISEQSQTSIYDDPAELAASPTHKHEAADQRLIAYIQSLEQRIGQLETQQTQDPFWRSHSNLASESEERTVIEQSGRGWSDEEEEREERRRERMTESGTSDMTESGTTHYSSSTDDGAGVYVMGDEMVDVAGLEVRTLPPIDEVDEESRKNSTLEREPPRDRLSALAPHLVSAADHWHELPPRMAPLSASMLSVGRLSLASSDLSDRKSEQGTRPSSTTATGEGEEPPVGRSTPLNLTKTSSILTSGGEQKKDDGVKLLRIHDHPRRLANRDSAVIHQMYQAAWDSLECSSSSPRNISSH